MVVQLGRGAQSKDYYRILRLHPDANAELVDRAYWQLAHLYNAAIRSDPAAKPKLDELNEAYAVLGSPNLRRDYDRARGIVRRDSEWIRETLRRDRRRWWFFQRTPTLPPPVAEKTPEPSSPTVAQRTARASSPPVAQKPTRASSPPVTRKTARPHRLSSTPKTKSAGGLPWPAFASTISVLALASAALFTGAQPILMLGLLFVAVTFTASSFLPALRLRAQLGSLGWRRLERPANLEGAHIPGGSSQGVRKLVHQIYAQYLHLGPGDVQAVARYALLTQRFIRAERSLGTGYAGSDDAWWHLAAEQRTLATELRQHEVALGMTKGASPPTAATKHHGRRAGSQERGGARAPDVQALASFTDRIPPDVRRRLFDE